MLNGIKVKLYNQIGHNYNTPFNVTNVNFMKNYDNNADLIFILLGIYLTYHICS